MSEEDRERPIRIRNKLMQRVEATLDDHESKVDGAFITAITRLLEREGVRPSIMDRDDKATDRRVHEQAARARRQFEEDDGSPLRRVS